MQVCSRPICEKCANFEKPCAGVNTECIDVDESKTCICKEPFSRDDSGDCNKCNAVRPFSWQCTVGKPLFKRFPTIPIFADNKLKLTKNSHFNKMI